MSSYLKALIKNRALRSVQIMIKYRFNFIFEAKSE